MATSMAKMVDQQIREEYEYRGKIISTVRSFILEHLPQGYSESMNGGSDQI